jgi:sulfate transport system ATP-binding protein
MSFLGPVSKLDDGLVRPHDIHIVREPGDGTREAMVNRVVHLGFEVRVELELGDSAPVTAQLTRDQAEVLELSERDVVWLRTNGSSRVSA